MIAAGHAGDDLAMPFGDAAQLAAAPARQFQHVRIALLRHDRRASGEGIGQTHEAEFLGRVQQQIPAQFLQRAGHRDQPVKQRLLVAATRIHDIHRRALHARKSQQFRHTLTTQRQGHTKAGCGAQRAAIQPSPEAIGGLHFLDQPFDIADGPLADTGGHGAAQMGVSGHRHRLVGAGEIEQRIGQRMHLRHQSKQARAQQQSQGQQHLIIARAPQVDTLSGLPHPLDQRMLQRGVAVFLIVRNHQLAALGHGLQFGQCRDQRRGIGGRQQPGLAQHSRMRGRSLHIEGQQGKIELRILAHGKAVDGRVQRQSLGPQWGAGGWACHDR